MRQLLSVHVTPSTQTGNRIAGQLFGLLVRIGLRRCCCNSAQHDPETCNYSHVDCTREHLFPMVIESIKPDILDPFCQPLWNRVFRWGWPMDMVADCSSASNRRAKSVLPDDRIILLDVNYPASMGPTVTLLEPQWIIDDSHMTWIAGNSSHSEATGQSMFLQPFSFVFYAERIATGPRAPSERSSRSIDVWSFG